MAEQRPSFPFYPKDYLSSATVSAMPLAAQGLYVRLLSYAWQSDGLTADEGALQRTVGVSRQEWRKLWPYVAPLWETRDGKLYNRKQEHVRTESAAFTEAARAAGKASVAARREKYGSASPSNGRSNGSPNGPPNGSPNGSFTNGSPNKPEPAFATAIATATTTTASKSEAVDAPALGPRPVDAEDYGPSPARRLSPNEAFASRLGVNVPRFIHEQLTERLRAAGEPAPEVTLQAWYRAIDAEWLAKRIVVGEKAPKFWEARFEETHGCTPRAPSRPTEAAFDVDAAVAAQLALHTSRRHA